METALFSKLDDVVFDEMQNNSAKNIVLFSYLKFPFSSQGQHFLKSLCNCTFQIEVLQHGCNNESIVLCLPFFFGGRKTPWKVSTCAIHLGVFGDTWGGRSNLESSTWSGKKSIHFNDLLVGG